MAAAFSDAILAIYDAALSVHRWEPALSMLAKESGALGAVLVAKDQVDLPYQIEQSSFPMEGVRRYFDQFGHYDRAVLTGPAEERPPLTLVRDVDAWGAGEALQSRPDAVWLRENLGARSRALIRLSANSGWRDQLALLFGTDWGQWPAAAEHSLGQLLPHLAQVVSINRRFTILRQRYHAALAALDQIRIGTCVISSNCEVVVANHEAKRIFSETDGIRLLSSNRIELSREIEAVRFSAALRSVIATSSGEDCDSEIFFLVPRRSRKQPFIVELAPIRDSDAELCSGFHGALMYLIDPLNLATLTAARLSKLFSLTAAETDVCQMMLNGLSASEVAERRNVSEGTVKTQFRAIYAKLGISRRVDLIRLALTVDPPIM